MFLDCNVLQLTGLNVFGDTKRMSCSSFTKLHFGNETRTASLCSFGCWSTYCDKPLSLAVVSRCGTLQQKRIPITLLLWLHCYCCGNKAHTEVNMKSLMFVREYISHDRRAFETQSKIRAARDHVLLRIQSTNLDTFV